MVKHLDFTHLNNSDTLAGEGGSIMKKYRGSWFGLCLGLALILGLSIVPTLTVTADAPPIVGDWGGTLDPLRSKPHLTVEQTAQACAMACSRQLSLAHLDLTTQFGVARRND
jgi:hypothetical protein